MTPAKISSRIRSKDFCYFCCSGNNLHLHKLCPIAYDTEHDFQLFVSLSRLLILRPTENPIAKNPPFEPLVSLTNGFVSMFTLRTTLVRVQVCEELFSLLMTTSNYTYHNLEIVRNKFSSSKQMFSNHSVKKTLRGVRLS